MLDIPSMVNATVLEERVSDSLHPSSLGLCVRKQMLRVKGAEQSHPMPEWLRWELARYATYEEYFRKAFTAHGVLVGDHERLSMGPWSGEVDFIISVGQELAIVEVKSVKKMGLAYAPYDHHKMQAWAYWRMATAGTTVVGATSLYLAYITRWWESAHELPEIMQVDITPSALDLQATYKEMEAVERAYHSGAVPDIPFDHPEEDPWQCVRAPKRGAAKLVSCEYFSHCWPGLEEMYSEDGTMPF